MLLKRVAGTLQAARLPGRMLFSSTSAPQGEVNQRCLTGKDASTLQVGDWSELSMRMDDDRVRRFAEVTGDFNSIHLDETAASKSRFKQRVAHGFLSASLIPTLFATSMPGSIYLSQNLKFKAPVFLGDTVTVKITVAKITPKPRNLGTVVFCDTQCRVCDDNGDRVVIDGTAEVLIPEATSD